MYTSMYYVYYILHSRFKEIHRDGHIHSQMSLFLFESFFFFGEKRQIQPKINKCREKIRKLYSNSLLEKHMWKYEKISALISYFSSHRFLLFFSFELPFVSLLSPILSWHGILFLYFKLKTLNVLTYTIIECFLVCAWKIVNNWLEG